MCYFVTIGVPERHRQRLAAVAREHTLLDVSASANPSVARQFPAGDALCTVTQGGCSCRLYADAGTKTDAEQEAARRAQYRRRGWSEAKISRALESSRRSRAAPDVDARAVFRELVAAIVDTTGHVRLFAHLYAHGVDTEDVGPAARLTLALREFERREGAFAADAVVEVVRDGA